jgi:transposase
MPKKKPDDPKLEVLRQHASLHPHPEKVRDELFQSADFFDPRDLAQVKYEMLRRVQKDGESVSQTATAFGFSRPSFYQAQAAFEEAGLMGLVPQKRGPRQGHKLTPEVVEFIRQQRQADPSLRMPAMLASVKERFGIDLHPRTVERGLARSQKKRRKSG